MAEETRSVTDLPPSLNKGPIAWMARNTVASNLFMFVLFVGGLIGVFRTKQEVFPEFSLDLVTIAVAYPGASPEEVEQGIVLAVEEAVRGVDGVKRVTSNSAEGRGSIGVELLLDADPDKVLSDVKTEVDRIRSFPEEAERPVVTLASRKREVISLVIAGDKDLGTLHALGERARASLLDLPDITQVELYGVPPIEVSIEISREQANSLGLSPVEIARIVSLASLELPGGEIETAGGELLVRVADRIEEGHAFGDIIVRQSPTGGTIRLRDVATIKDGYADLDQAYVFNGKPAVRITAYRVGDETPSSVARAVRNFAEEFRAQVPDDVEVAIWGDDSEILEDRISLLVRNAAQGLILVLIVLALFLHVRLAFWVGLGIPVAFMGAFLVMPVLDISINMVSLFGFIVTLGLVVDDAIIVGEHAFSKMEDGVPPLRASILAAQEMAVPVTFAILTSVASFAPLLFVPGVMGKIFKILPIIVSSVLLFSLVEGFMVLPSHVGHTHQKLGPQTDIMSRLQAAVARGLEYFTERLYRPTLIAFLRQRYLALAGSLALLIMVLSLVAAGIVPFNFFPDLEGDKVVASVKLPYGAPESLREDARRKLERAARQTVEENGGDSIVRGMFTRLGEGPIAGGPAGGASETGGHLLTVEMNLVPIDFREVTAGAFAERWQKNLEPIVGAESVSITSSFGPSGGAAVDVQLTHMDIDVLAAASEDLAQEIRSFPQLRNVENSFSAGKPQLDFHLLARARSLGVTSTDVAMQLRGAFFGIEALREQRGRNEVKVMVRLPETQRESEFDLEQLRIRTPQGSLVPITEVASFERGRSPTTIVREDGQRVVNVRAALAPGVPSSRPILDEITQTILPRLKEKYPRLEASFVGAQRAQKEAMIALVTNGLFSMFVVFALLAIPFRSYAQPFVIMFAIPFGIVGAVLGHMIMGYGLSIISGFGIVALAGVVVNDSLVLVDAANTARREGRSAWEAIIFGGTRRLRPILLTSLTTFFGLMPMIFETSVQARFLIPMAISLGFGVMFATVIALLIVPALYIVLEDVKSLFGMKTGFEHDDAEDHALAGARKPPHSALDTLFD